MSADSSLNDIIGQQVNRGFFGWMISRQVFWVLMAAILACIALSLLTNTFATPGNLWRVVTTLSTASEAAR